jgi:hypothetical protein
MHQIGMLVHGWAPLELEADFIAGFVAANTDGASAIHH